MLWLIASLFMFLTSGFAVAAVYSNYAAGTGVVLDEVIAVILLLAMSGYLLSKFICERNGTADRQRAEKQARREQKARDRERGRQVLGLRRVDDPNAVNLVIGGDHKGREVTLMGGAPQIVLSRDWTENQLLDSVDVARYRVVDSETRSSAASGLARGILGGALLGTAGAVAGSLSARSHEVYTLSVEFKDGRKSLMVVDELIYRAIMRDCF